MEEGEATMDEGGGKTEKTMAMALTFLHIFAQTI